MRQIARAAALTLACVCCLSSAQAFDNTPAPVAAQGTQQVLFSPWDDIESAIISALDGARRQVLVQAYLLTSKPIAAALIAAHERNIEVRVLADAGQLQRTAASGVNALAAAGIPVWLETRYQHAHHKLIIIDAATILSGSYNFTWTAQHKNAENLLILRNNPALAARYAMNWERHRQDATPYKK